ncbi:helix-turn-helix transcriptional regulator [Tumebacillus sp. DT12]|uniref:Helix-turn-helix transcriptional regulator n=1 Tax=Tumebacillus lacus TaxID=2995335 RepID=A0ABT3WX27_9BACL|nr:helix-turn-helix transcriptional regulator [Tumebacillus lacus]MCX7569199.1 helix-turn-helix transcriptional regulator [Tumebacillus lacus]
MLTIEKPKTLYKGGTKATGLKSVQVGEKVRYHRLQRGLSQQELADGLCSVQLISAIERGTNNPRVKTLEMIADRLNVPLKEIYQPDEDEFPNRVKLQLVEAYMKRGEYEAAQLALSQLDDRDDLVEIERQFHALLQGELYNKIGKAQEACDLLDGLIDTLEIRKNADDEFRCKAYNQLGTSYFSMRDFTKAYAAYMRGYQSSLRLSTFDMTAASVTYNLAITCNELGINDEARQYLEMASKYYESVSDLRKLADVYFSSAIATHDSEFLLKAKNIYESLECFSMLQVVRQFQAYHFDVKDSYLSAVDTLLDIGCEFEKLNEHERALFTYSRTVLLCVDNDDSIRATDAFTLATRKFHEIGNETGQYTPYYYFARAKYNFSRQSYDQCLQSAEKASMLYGKMGMKTDKSKALDLIVQVYKQQGNYREALEVSLMINELLRYEGRK